MAPADTPSLNNNEIPDSFRYTCNIKDDSGGVGNICESWIKEGESHKDIIVKNEDWKIIWSSPPKCYKKQMVGECDIVMQDAQDVCKSWMKQGMLYSIQTPPFGGGEVCLTPKGVARIRSGGVAGWKHTATPLGKPCDNAID
jgi:hypothetical protein